MFQHEGQKSLGKDTVLTVRDFSLAEIKLVCLGLRWPCVDNGIMCWKQSCNEWQENLILARDLLLCGSWPQDKSLTGSLGLSLLTLKAEARITVYDMSGTFQLSPCCVVCQREIWGELDQFVLVGEICLGEAVVEEKCHPLLGWANCGHQGFLKPQKPFCGSPI